MSDMIEQTINIAAPQATVWQVITEPRYIAQWFSDEAELDARVGGKGVLRWKTLGTSPIEIIAVDQPSFFSYRWVSPDANGKSTTIEFYLSEQDGQTTLRLVERGLDGLDAADKATLIGRRVSGWQHFLGKLAQCAAGLGNS